MYGVRRQLRYVGMERNVSQTGVRSLHNMTALERGVGHSVGQEGWTDAQV